MEICTYVQYKGQAGSPGCNNGAKVYTLFFFAKEAASPEQVSSLIPGLNLIGEIGKR